MSPSYISEAFSQFFDGGQITKVDLQYLSLLVLQDSGADADGDIFPLLVRIKTEVGDFWSEGLFEAHRDWRCQPENVEENRPRASLLVNR
jgi:hypothetical protein